VAVKGASVAAGVVEVETCVGSADTAADCGTVVAAMGLEGGGGVTCASAVEAGADCEPVADAVEVDFGGGGTFADAVDTGLVVDWVDVDANLVFVRSGFFSDNFCTLLITFCALSSGVCFTFLASLAFWRLSLSIALFCSISC